MSWNPTDELLWEMNEEIINLLRPEVSHHTIIERPRKLLVKSFDLIKEQQQKIDKLEEIRDKLSQIQY